MYREHPWVTNSSLSEVLAANSAVTDFLQIWLDTNLEMVCEENLKKCRSANLPHSFGMKTRFGSPLNIFAQGPLDTGSTGFQSSHSSEIDQFSGLQASHPNFFADTKFLPCSLLNHFSRSSTDHLMPGLSNKHLSMQVAS